MSALAESASIKAMAEKIERLEKELATWQSASHLPSQLGDFAQFCAVMASPPFFTPERSIP
jgi:hypothetical protein